MSDFEVYFEIKRINDISDFTIKIVKNSFAHEIFVSKLGYLKHLDSRF
jgi:hypothetical protein